MNPRHRLVTLAVLTALALPAAAGAQGFVPPAGGVADLVGPRTLALGGATGVVSGNDGLFVNPAAVAARKRYAVETFFAVDRRGGATAGQYVGGSVVDALSGPVTASLAWVRPLEGFQGGNLFVGGLAGPLADRLYVGAQLRYLALRQDGPVAGTTEKVNAVTADAGLFWEASDGITLGFSGFNLVPSGNTRAAPRSVGAGLAVGSDTSLKLVADWRADLDRLRDAAGKARTTNRFAAGVEMLLGNSVPLRAGYLKDETLDTSWWCAGMGLITASGVAIDVGYRQSLDARTARVIAVAFKVHYLEL